MSTSVLEIKEKLTNSIDELRNSFDEYDFQTNESLSASDLNEISGFERFAVLNNEVISFEAFRRKIVKSLFSLDNDVNVSDFDWDVVESQFDEVSTEYAEYQSVLDQVQDNITGDQDSITVALESAEDIKSMLLQHLIDQNLIYEITVEGEIHYLVHDKLRKQL